MTYISGILRLGWSEPENEGWGRNGAVPVTRVAPQSGTGGDGCIQTWGGLAALPPNLDIVVRHTASVCVYVKVDVLVDSLEFPISFIAKLEQRPEGI